MQLAVASSEFGLSIVTLLFEKQSSKMPNISTQGITLSLLTERNGRNRTKIAKRNMMVNMTGSGFGGRFVTVKRII